MGCSSGSLQSRESTRHLPRGHFAWQGAALGDEASGRRPRGQSPEGWLALSWPCACSALLSHLQSHWHLVFPCLSFRRRKTGGGAWQTCSPLPHLWSCRAAGHPGHVWLPEGQAIHHSGQSPTCPAVQSQRVQLSSVNTGTQMSQFTPKFTRVATAYLVIAWSNSSPNYL